jgi:putative flippase GtrA
MIICLPKQIWVLLCCLFGAKPQVAFWKAFYAYFEYLPDVNHLASQFWNERRLRRLNHAYLAVRQKGDLILSASPDCLLKPVCQTLNVGFIGASVDARTGACSFRGCCATEKLHRFRQQFPKEKIEVFWSTRLSDHPVAQEAEQSYIVRGRRVADWDTILDREGHWRKWLRHFLSPEFFRFWCVGWLNMAVAWVLEASWSLLFSPNLAFSVGYAMSLLCSFVLNSKITFRIAMTVNRLGKYILSYIPNFLVQTLTVLLFHNLLHWPHLLAYFLAAVVGTPVTFFCLKFFAFHKRSV